MPYQIVKGKTVPKDLTDLEEKALEYMKKPHKDAWIGSSAVAVHFGLAPQAMRSPMHQLYLKGLLRKLY